MPTGEGISPWISSMQKPGCLFQPDSGKPDCGSVGILLPSRGNKTQSDGMLESCFNQKEIIVIIESG